MDEKRSYQQWPRKCITILLGPKDYQVKQVKEDAERVITNVMFGLRERKCSYCDFATSYQYSTCKPRKAFHKKNSWVRSQETKSNKYALIRRRAVEGLFPLVR